MLQLYKNQVVTAVAKRQVEIRKLELDWYTNNYWTLSQQGALLAGFSFSLITASLPKDASFFLESLYLLLAALALGLQMCVVVTTTLCCMWGPGLALRGPDGIRSVHTAVDSLKSEHSYVFAFFFLGLLSFYLSNLPLVFLLFEDWIAISASALLALFLFLIFYYTIRLTSQLRVSEADAVEGKIAALRAYEDIADLDEAVAPGFCSPAEGDSRTEELLGVRDRAQFSPLARAHLPRAAIPPTQEDLESAGAAYGVRQAATTEMRAPESMQATPQGFLAALDELFEF
ncbi:hypothetical protein TGME49_259050 [Toxoplasma gondii ME49]|uniref:Transmembrane protein n=2 Tax=Toxoplasma gondii TaxID=5811 RepID=S8GC53_TOXGM|nr:hypothetical protein TGME49_259050 [Toxoplasma gondii ME49]EPT29405.1 hypothetical protein TGME49_259050 [Toxoplasma gondii ME49]ESS32259.1 putative transmembrane protein [Toxoplasma gondii VEG]CEL74422.1 TPA: hypothetical protein BN1205_075390 [Toxoplasma gondii VEG]|eukprot:XP_018637036.1 hypothetical protein TGME49_259050 [Toxoplasma gondii ME49]